MTGADGIEESELTEKLAAMSRHTSVMALESVIRLASANDAAQAALRTAAVAQHIGAGIQELARSLEIARRAAAAENGTPAEPIAV
jgi:hypothetical protein